MSETDVDPLIAAARAWTGKTILSDDDIERAREAIAAFEAEKWQREIDATLARQMREREEVIHAHP